MLEASVSVVIPAYNAARYVGAAIESALAQAPAPMEVVVVDDGSTDDTFAVAARFGGCVRVLQRPNGGISAARNTGVAAATGEWLAFLDADDLWLPGKLDRQLRALAEAGAPAICFTHVTQFASPDLPQAERAALSFDSAPMPGIIASSMLVRREDFARVGPFREGLRVGEFVDWFGRARDIGLVEVVVTEALVRRRIHATNTGRGPADDRVDFTRVLRERLARLREAGE